MNPHQNNQSNENGQRTTDTRLRLIQREGDFVVLIAKWSDVISARHESLRNQEMLSKDRSSNWYHRRKCYGSTFLSSSADSTKYLLMNYVKAHLRATLWQI